MRRHDGREDGVGLEPSFGLGTGAEEAEGHAEDAVVGVESFHYGAAGVGEHVKCQLGRGRGRVLE